MTVTVRVTVNEAAIERILNRSEQELSSWARHVLYDRVEPITPVETGELRASSDMRVFRDGERNVNVVWYWKAPYAAILETSDYSPRTPGTRIPFAVPTITEAVKEEIGEVVKRGFEG